MENMEAQILTWIELARKSIEATSVAQYPDCEPNHETLTFKKGRKFFKLISKNIHRPETSGSVYAFIDMEGNIFKAATWAAPAKGARGHINKVDATKVTTSTGWLYR